MWEAPEHSTWNPNRINPPERDGAQLSHAHLQWGVIYCVCGAAIEEHYCGSGPCEKTGCSGLTPSILEVNQGPLQREQY